MRSFARKQRSGGCGAAVPLALAASTAGALWTGSTFASPALGLRGSRGVVANARISSSGVAASESVAAGSNSSSAGYRIVFAASAAAAASAVAARGLRRRVVREARRSCHGGAHLSKEAKAELAKVCAAIAVSGKGITACDESAGTIGIRFEAVGIENTEEHRRLYRQMLFQTEGVGEYLSAAILDPETMYQKNDEGVLFPEALTARNIIPGVKPHLKVYELPGTDGDTVMQGLDSLAVRCREYKAAGAKFAKWRSPIAITVGGAPSRLAVESNMRDLARYALICQDEGLVPIVEPDVIMKGDHDLETAVAVNVQLQSSLYKEMLEHGVYMEGTILKTNMVNPGLSCPTAFSVEEIAEANVATLRRVMPVAIPGVNFLSGGQSLEDAAARLNAINKAKSNSPWNISFSWSAALQMPLFELCRETKGVLPLKEMGELYLKELKIAGAAALGKHSPKEGEGAHVPK